MVHSHVTFVPMVRYANRKASYIDCNGQSSSIVNRQAGRVYEEVSLCLLAPFVSKPQYHPRTFRRLLWKLPSNFLQHVSPYFFCRSISHQPLPDRSHAQTTGDSGVRRQYG